MFDIRAQITANTPVAPGTFRMRLATGGAYDRAIPGQFVMVGLPGGADPLLRRPFSIHRRFRDDGGGGIELLVKVVGRGTKAMAAMPAGESLDLLGPLGNGFDLPGPADPVFLVGGGVGIAPLVFLAETIREQRDSDGTCRAFIGGRTRDELLCADVIDDMNIESILATDDGSLGEAGFVTDSLRTRMAAGRPEIIYACGPTPMLAAVAAIARENNVRCQVSIETMMACGMGACLGCAVRKQDGDGYLHACRDGPVFDAKQILFR